MLWAILGAALAGTATLHVGVHRQAGGVYDIAADGAAGLCTATQVRITCPADAPVQFRWAGGAEFTLVGDVEVGVDQVGTAWVLATEESRETQLQQLGKGVDRDVVQALFAPAPGVPAIVPSLQMVKELERLARHPDPHVRRAVVDAMVPLWRHTASDPFHVDAPELLAPGLIGLLASDADVRVRRRLAMQLRDLRAPGHDQREEADEALGRLLNDSRTPVQRTATATLKIAVGREVTNGEDAWLAALDRVKVDGPAGRAACNTLSYLARSVEAGGAVQPREGMHQILQHHPERAWTFWFAWREALRWEEAWLDILLRDTVGLHRGLLRAFGKKVPEDLADTLERWEPAGPHSERWLLIQTWLADVEDPSLREALQLPANAD